MLKPLQEKKLTKLFGVFDANGDGRYQLADQQIIMNRLAAYGGWEEGSAERKALDAKMMALWNKSCDLARIDPEEGFSLETWLSAHLGIIQFGAEDFVYGWVAAMFDLYDVDEDGVISEAEFAAFFDAHGIARELAAKSFARMDQNGDGGITRDEFVQLTREFLLSDDPTSPGNHLYGPLDE